MRSRRIALLVACLTAGPCFSASVIDFDSLGDGETVTNQFAAMGVNFQGVRALSAGLSLNEFEFPPRSDFNVITDESGPILITFSLPQSMVLAYFTYTQAITIRAFDAASADLGSVSSQAGCASNLALSGTAGCLPNQLITLSGLGNISRVMISGAPNGGSFTLDDLTFEPTAMTSVPEPAYALLTVAVLAFAVIRHQRRRRSSLSSFKEFAR